MVDVCDIMYEMHKFSVVLCIRYIWLLGYE